MGEGLTDGFLGEPLIDCELELEVGVRVEGKAREKVDLSLSDPPMNDEFEVEWFEKVDDVGEGDDDDKELVFVVIEEQWLD